MKTPVAESRGGWSRAGCRKRPAPPRKVDFRPRETVDFFFDEMFGTNGSVNGERRKFMFESYVFNLDTSRSIHFELNCKNHHANILEAKDVEKVFLRPVPNSRNQSGSGETNLTSIHGDASSIPGLAQGVKDAALP